MADETKFTADELDKVSGGNISSDEFERMRKLIDEIPERPDQYRRICDDTKTQMEDLLRLMK